MSRSYVVAVGVDGCSNGWIAVALEQGTIVAVEYLPTIDELSARFADATTIGIDIPMGFPTTSEPRKSELEAKKILNELLDLQSTNNIDESQLRCAMFEIAMLTMKLYVLPKEN